MELECRSGPGDEFIQKIAVIWAQLPKEVIPKILVWLPVKSLLRFRCVSKSFRALIDSRYFINLHLNTSANNKTHLKLVFKGGQRVSTNYNSVKLCVSDIENCLDEDNRRLLKNQLTKGLDLNGYCNGVFLLVVNSFQLALWNPSTHKYRNLPHCPVKRDNTSLCWDHMGLGYESTRDDYKVVLIAAVNGRIGCQNFEVWIFGLKSNLWRMVRTDFSSKERFLNNPFGCFANGELHWLTSLNGNNFYSEEIIAFDVVKETFSLVTLPVYPTRGRVTRLYVLDGCLCNNFLSESCELVVLYVRKKDGDDVFTWSILYSVTTAQLPPFLKMYYFDCVKVFGYSKDGDEIILDLGCKYMISYDLKEKSFRTTTIPSRNIAESCIRPCFESLVRVDDGDLQIQLGRKYINGNEA